MPTCLRACLPACLPAFLLTWLPACLPASFLAIVQSDRTISRSSMHCHRWTDLLSNLRLSSNVCKVREVDLVHG